MPVFLFFSSVAFLGSLLSTFVVERFLLERISLLGTFLGFEKIQNAGIAFGIDLPWWILTILLPVAVMLLGTLAWQSRRNRFHAVCFGLILGGALGNIIDRFDDGHVTDFIQIGWWPVFNIADSCISLGVGMLLFWELRSKGKRKNGKEQVKI